MTCKTIFHRWEETGLRPRNNGAYPRCAAIQKSGAGIALARHDHRKKGTRMKSLRLLLLLTPLALLTGDPARATGLYQTQPIITLGDKVGSPPLHTSEGLWVGALNDSGQIAFVTGNSTGGPLLLRYVNGQFAPIVVAGQIFPLGTWPPLSVVWSPVSMNQSGSIAFSVLDQQAGAALGTFVWNPKTQQVTPIALKGMSASGNLTFVAGGGPSPAINNHNDIAFVADVKNAGGEIQSGVFLQSGDGKLQPVALPDQALPDGGQIQSASHPSLNDNGAVAFLAIRKGDTATSAFVWANGMIAPVAAAGGAAPGGGNFSGIWGAWVNNKNPNVLVEANVKSLTAAHSLYLFTGDTLTPVAAAGKNLPGGTLKGVEGGVSAANDAGQHVFLAALTDKTTAAYLLNADGTVTLLLKSSATTEPGAIVRVGEASTFGVGLNNKGQVALVVRFAGGRSGTLVLMTPQ